MGLKDRPLLSKSETKIADFVLRNYRVNQRDLMKMLYEDREDGGAEYLSIIGVFINSINHKLRPQGIRLLSHKGYGYRFEQITE